MDLDLTSPLAHYERKLQAARVGIQPTQDLQSGKGVRHPASNTHSPHNEINLECPLGLKWMKSSSFQNGAITRLARWLAYSLDV